MIKPIVHDTFLLSQKSVPAEAEDLSIAMDLLDTLRANQAVCVGMAANMIGSLKRIIVFSAGMFNIAMINPVIISKSGPYQAREGCLSLQGQRTAARYQQITVTYQDINMVSHTTTYKGNVAQIIQHEIDHCDGILI